MNGILKEVYSLQHEEYFYPNINITLPNKCPMCNTAVNISPKFSLRIDKNEKANSSRPKSTDLFSLFFCTNCERSFIGNYIMHDTYAEAVSFEPKKNIEKKIFSSYISELSPDFCEIYNQAYIAQQQNLDKISGMGYRKALEFLVKDYAIFLNPEDEDKIKNASLSSCINNYIDNKKIRHLSLASTWLGNDETHYIKKYQDYTIDNIITFIDATVSFIDSDLAAIKAEKLISSRHNK